MKPVVSDKSIAEIIDMQRENFALLSAFVNDIIEVLEQQNVKFKPEIDAKSNLLRRLILKNTYEHLSRLEAFRPYLELPKTDALVAFLIDSGVNPKDLANDRFLLNTTNVRIHYWNARKKRVSWPTESTVESDDDDSIE